MATEYVTYWDKYGNKRSFPKPDNWEDRNKKEKNKKEEQETKKNDNSSLFNLQDNDLEEKLSKMGDKEFIETIKDVENEIGISGSSHPYKDNIFTREYFKRFGDPKYGNMVLKENPANLDLKRLGLEKSSPKTPSQDDIDNTYFNNYKKDQERLDQAREKMSKPVEKKEDTFEYHEHDMNLARQAYKSSMGDKKEFLRKMRQDYNWDNEDAKKYYDKVNNDRENALSGIFQKKETTKNFERGSKEHYDALVSSGMNKNDAQAIIDIEKGNLKHKEDQYGAYYEKQNVGKTIQEANKAYKDNKPIVDSNKKTTNEYMNDKIRNSNNKTVKALGDELRKKNGPVGLKDAKSYMEQDGSTFEVNYRNAQGYASGYMTNSSDNGDGISVRGSQLDSLEKYLRENGYERKKSGYSEYVFIWEKPKKSKSQIAKDQLEKYKDSLKDPTKSKVTKADMLKKIFKK